MKAKNITNGNIEDFVEAYNVIHIQPTSMNYKDGELYVTEWLVIYEEKE
jgi:hypothetical protein